MDFKWKTTMMASSLAIMLAVSGLPLFTAAESVSGNENTVVNEVTGDQEQASQETIVSEKMTFDELVKKYAEDNNISEGQAKKDLLVNYEKAHKTNDQKKAVQSVATATEFGVSAETIVSATSATYRTFTVVLEPMYLWSPKLSFYSETSEYGNWHGIVKVIDTTLIRTDAYGITKQFSGTTFTFLESASKIHWYVNGDFYNNGTTTRTAGVSIGLNQSTSIQYSISNSSNHFAYKYEVGDYNW